MTDILALDTHWVWDSWYARHQGRHHAYFLHAPRALGDPHARHHHAAVGHATSDDLTSWTLHEPALAPRATPAWDDLATWTGCVIQAPDGRWLMFYTGISRTEEGSVQRIGVAISDDLHTWERSGDAPILIADQRWYEADPEKTFDGVAWRDPWVFWGEDGRWHMLVTASARDWPATTGGVIGHAVSDDLLTWEARPPLTTPGTHRCLEVPQIVRMDGQFLLLFSVPRAETEGDENPLGDIWCARADSPLGPFHLDAAWKAEGSGLYAGRLVERGPDDLVLMGFVNVRDGGFVGVIDDPRPFDSATLVAAPAALASNERRSIAF